MTQKQIHIIEDVLNIMGGPTMDYEPRVAVKEWQRRWDVCYLKLLEILQ